MRKLCISIKFKINGNKTAVLNKLMLETTKSTNFVLDFHITGASKHNSRYHIQTTLQNLHTYVKNLMSHLNT